MMYAATSLRLRPFLGAPASGACMGWAGAQSVRRARAAGACRARWRAGERYAGERMPFVSGGFEQAIGVAGHPPGAARRRIARCAGALPRSRWARPVLAGRCRPRRVARERCVLPRRVRRRERCWAVRRRTSLRWLVAWRAASQARPAPARGPRGRRQRAHAAGAQHVGDVGSGGARRAQRLSFDRSLQLYTGHFDDGLARGGAPRRKGRGKQGFATRQDALRALALRVRQPAVLAHGVGDHPLAAVRHLAWRGSGAVGGTGTCGAKAQVEERVAKAPVKMMIPTGTLILPAMLLFGAQARVVGLLEGM